MAFYIFKCPKCENEVEVSRVISKRDDPCKCEECGVEMERAIISQSISVLWKQPNGKTDFCGPTRNKNFTVRDAAKENGWFNGKYSK